MKGFFVKESVLQEKIYVTEIQYGELISQIFKVTQKYQ